MQSHIRGDAHLVNILLLVFSGDYTFVVFFFLLMARNKVKNEKGNGTTNDRNAFVSVFVLGTDDIYLCIVSFTLLHFFKPSICQSFYTDQHTFYVKRVDRVLRLLWMRLCWNGLGKNDVH